MALHPQAALAIQRAGDLPTDLSPGMIHTFFTLGGAVEDAARAKASAAAALRRLS